MKRFFFTVIALSAVAVGCTKSGLLESPQTYEKPITFEPYTGKAPVTKASEATTDTIQTTGFHVIGFIEGDNNTISASNPELFRNVMYDATATTDLKWYYENAAFWPEGKELTFLAYGLNGAAAFTEATTDYTKLPFNVESTVAMQKDLVISPAIQNCDSETGTVVVELHHVLSKVGFKITTSGTAGVKATIKNIRLTGNFVTGGTFDLTRTALNTDAVEYTAPVGGGSTSVTYSLFDSDYTYGANYSTNTEPYPCFVTNGQNETLEIYHNANIVPGSSYTQPSAPTLTDGKLPSEWQKLKDARYMMIMPQTITDATVEVIYQLTEDIERMTSIPLSHTFLPGKAYEFNFTISTVAVGFDITVNEWTEQEVDTDPLTPVTPSES